MTGASIRIVTWNVHGSVGAGWRCDPAATLAVVARLRPDILALQEIDGRTHLGRRAGAFEAMRAALGDHLVEARMLKGRDPAHDHGHLLFSRWPLADAAVHALPGGRFEPRGVIDAVSWTPQGPLRILSAHFGLLRSDRRRQARFLAMLAAAGGLPTLALGDFNEWSATGPVHRALAAGLPIQAAPRSWPSRLPFVRMDRIYASPQVRILQAACDPDARKASDHLPLVADIVLTPAP